MNLNTFIDYTRSKPIRVHGFEAHLQASARHGDRTILLVQKPSGQARVPLQPHDLLHV